MCWLLGGLCADWKCYTTMIRLDYVIGAGCHLSLSITFI
jgi:hypothetical protein